MIVIVAYIVNIVDFRWFSDTSYKYGSACCISAFVEYYVS
ncbi:hypothetical protein T07_1979, partial [Trichinella nelsoni]